MPPLISVFVSVAGVNRNGIPPTAAGCTAMKLSATSNRQVLAAKENGAAPHVVESKKKIDQTVRHGKLLRKTIFRRNAYAFRTIGTG